MCTLIVLYVSDHFSWTLFRSIRDICLTLCRSQNWVIRMVFEHFNNLLKIKSVQQCSAYKWFVSCFPPELTLLTNYGNYRCTWQFSSFVSAARGDDNKCKRKKCAHSVVRPHTEQIHTKHIHLALPALRMHAATHITPFCCLPSQDFDLNVNLKRKEA